MIAAGISGRNYQCWLIHSLIASFNLFTFGAEQCQPAAVESDLLPAHVTYTSRTTEFLCSCIVCVCAHVDMYGCKHECKPVLRAAKAQCDMRRHQKPVLGFTRILGFVRNE